MTPPLRLATDNPRARILVQPFLRCGFSVINGDAASDADGFRPSRCGRIRAESMMGSKGWRMSSRGNRRQA